jgi:hypothetical protein
LLIETQKLSIKHLQDELGEEAEFDAEESPQMRSVRRECETRVNHRMVQLKSDMQREVDRQFELLKKAKKQRDGAREEADDAKRGAVTMFNAHRSHAVRSS